MVLIQRGGDPLRQALEWGRICDRDRRAAADGDRLELLGAHHGAQARAPGDLVQVVADAGKADDVLSGDPALRYADALVTQLLADTALHRVRELAPVGRRVANLHVAVGEPQADRGIGRTLHDNAVPARALQLRAPEAARLRLAESAGQRRFGADAVAPGARRHRARGDPGREDEHGVGAQRVGVGRDVFEEVVGNQAATAAVLPEPGLAGLLDAPGAVVEIDVQDLVVEAVGHGRVPSLRRSVVGGGVVSRPS